MSESLCPRRVSAKASYSGESRGSTRPNEYHESEYPCRKMMASPSGRHVRHSGASRPSRGAPWRTPLRWSRALFSPSRRLLPRWVDSLAEMMASREFRRYYRVLRFISRAGLPVPSSMRPAAASAASKKARTLVLYAFPCVLDCSVSPLPFFAHVRASDRLFRAIPRVPSSLSSSRVDAHRLCSPSLLGRFLFP